MKMHGERISRLGGISGRTIIYIENNSLHGKIPRRFVARSFHGKNRFTNGKEFGNYKSQKRKGINLLAEKLAFRVSNSCRSIVCGNSSAVEHRLAKARVAGSNPVSRST